MKKKQAKKNDEKKEEKGIEKWLYIISRCI